MFRHRNRRRPTSDGPATRYGFEEVLRPVLGDKLEILPRMENSGHGDFGDIWGVMWHHTGNAQATARSTATVDQIATASVQSSCPGRHRNDCRCRRLLSLRVRERVPACHQRRQQPGSSALNVHGPPSGPMAPSIRASGGRTRDHLDAPDVGGALTKGFGHGAERNIGTKIGRIRPGQMGSRQHRHELVPRRGRQGDAWRVQPEPPVAPLPKPVDPPLLPKPANPRSDRILLEEIWDQLRGPGGNGWLSSATCHSSISSRISARTWPTYASRSPSYAGLNRIRSRGGGLRSAFLRRLPRQ